MQVTTCTDTMKLDHRAIAQSKIHTRIRIHVKTNLLNMYKRNLQQSENLEESLYSKNQIGILWQYSICKLSKSYVRSRSENLINTAEKILLSIAFCVLFVFEIKTMEA